jgi:hypothetical protein
MASKALLMFALLLAAAFLVASANEQSREFIIITRHAWRFLLASLDCSKKKNS